MLKTKSYYITTAGLLLLLSCKVVSSASQSANYLDATLPVEKRVKNLLSQMTLEEKVAQMCQYTGFDYIDTHKSQFLNEVGERSDAKKDYPEFESAYVKEMVKKGMIGSFLHVLNAEKANELQQLNQQSRLKIPILIGIDAIHGTGLVSGATVYPTPIGMASTWEPSLVRKISEETADEMRASGATWAFTPSVDVSRDARWGRVGETFGEDPFLVGLMGKATIEGLQYHPDKEKFRTISCVKHLVGGSQPVNGINGAPTDISERTLREVFLPPYKDAIDAGAYTLMTAHNELNGIPCHADKWMMDKVVRKEFGFKGFIVSDWMDIQRIASKHKTANNQKESVYKAVDAGVDMNMQGPDFYEQVIELVKEGKLSEEKINASVSKILEAKFRLGLFENPFVNVEEVKKLLFTQEHQQTALATAQKSIVLLKNTQNLLPLTKGKYKNIMVTGPCANNQTLLGDWASKQPEENVITMLEGLQMVDAAAKFDWVDVGYNPRHVKPEHVNLVKEKAKQADLNILFVGENSYRHEWGNKTSGENSDRPDVSLVGLQQQLVEAAYASGKPTIVVLVGGRPLAVEWIAENVPAIVEAWEPGTKGGLALAQILYGEVNPSAKLPITLPRSSGHILSVYNHKPSHFFNPYMVGNSTPLYPFGYGLSYTKYNYGTPVVENGTITKTGKVKISIPVTNIGDRAGEEVVQLYIRDQVSSATRPVKELKEFSKVFLNPGETKNVSFELDAKKFAFYDVNFVYCVEQGKFTVFIGASSLDSDLKAVEVEASERIEFK